MFDTLRRSDGAMPVRLIDIHITQETSLHPRHGRMRLTSLDGVALKNKGDFSQSYWLVTPSHLYWGDAGDNFGDMWKTPRHRQADCEEAEDCRP